MITFVSGAARSGFQLRGLVLERRDGFGHRSCLQERYLIERTVSHLLHPGPEYADGHSTLSP